MKNYNNKSFKTVLLKLIFIAMQGNEAFFDCGYLDFVNILQKNIFDTLLRKNLSDLIQWGKGMISLNMYLSMFPLSGAY